MLYKRLSAPLIVQVEITTACNNRCGYCYNPWRDTNPDKNAVLSPDETQLIMGQFAEAGVFRCVITGGEPLLKFAKEATFRAIRVGSEAGIICHLNTNATTLTEEDAIRLKNLRVPSVLVSLISHDEATHDLLAQRKGAQRQTLRGIQLLTEQGVRVGISMVLTPYNADHILDTARLAKQVGARGFYVTKASCPVSFAREEFAPFRVSPEVLKQSLEILLEIEKTLGFSVDILEAYPHCFLGDLTDTSGLPVGGAVVG